MYTAGNVRQQNRSAEKTLSLVSKFSEDNLKTENEELQLIEISVSVILWSKLNDKHNLNI